MSNKLGFCDATKKMVSKHLLVVVQSKHSVVEAGKDVIGLLQKRKTVK